MPHAVVASPVALVSSSCLSDRMPIEVRRRRQRRWEKNEKTWPQPRARIGYRRDAEGSKEDAVGIRNGLRNQMGQWSGKPSLSIRARHLIIPPRSPVRQRVRESKEESSVSFDTHRASILPRGVHGDLSQCLRFRVFRVSTNTQHPGCLALGLAEVSRRNPYSGHR